MGMFDKIKDVANLRAEAKKMQEQLEKITVTKERHGIEITVNGNQEVVDFKLPEDKSKLTADAIKRLINEALEVVKKDAAKQMQGLFQ